MRIKVLWSNMFCEIAFHIAHMHLCNTSSVIFIDNGEGTVRTQATWLLDVADHSFEPNTFLCGLIKCNYL